METKSNWQLAGRQIPDVRIPKMMVKLITKKKQNKKNNPPQLKIIPLYYNLFSKKKKEIFPVWVFTFTLNLSVHHI